MLVFGSSAAKSTITALDESNNLGQLSYENLTWTIGENIGWGVQTVSMPGNVNVGGTLSGNGSGLTSLNPANIAGGTANINISGNAANFTGSLAGDVTGTQGSTTVARLQGRAMSNAAPAVGQIIKWDGAAWSPGTDNSGGGADNLGNHNATTRIQPTVGNAATAGLYWPTDPGGGGGDEAFIRYYAESGENTKLLIGTNNDGDDDISFLQAGAERMTIYNGNVGIGTTTPAAPLHLATNNFAQFGPNQSWGANLKVGGNGWTGGYASVVTTDGNLHLDALAGHSTYLNWYAGNAVYFGNAATAERARIDGSGVVLSVGSYQGNGSGLTSLNAANLTGTVPVGQLSGTYNINVSGQAQYHRSVDTRILAPASYAHNQMTYGFTAYNNNNAAPWADFMLLNSYQDASGGSDNLLTFSRSSIAARLWQQTWNSGTAFGSYKDFAFIQDGIAQFSNNANYTSGAGSANTLPKYTGATTLGNSIITDDGTTVTSNGQTDVTGGTGTVYNTAPIEVRTTNTPRIAFHWPGVVASQLGMDSAGVIRTYDNPGTSYAAFGAAAMTGTIFYDRDNTNYYADPASTTILNNLRWNVSDCVNGTCPPNNAVRMTPNFHFNAGTGYAMIVNWDNGAVGGGTQMLRVGNGQGTDQFYVRADGQFWGRHFADLDDSGYYINPNGTSQVSTIYANSWFRAQGQSGFYFQDYGGGWYMTDGTWIRGYGSKPLYMDTGYDSGGASGAGCGGGRGGAYTFQVCGSEGANSWTDRDNTACVLDPSATSLIQYAVANKWMIRNNGNGDVYIGTQDSNGTGLLPGYSGNRYPVLGTTSSNIYLTIAGNYTGYWHTGGYTQVSDERMKTHIKDLGADDVKKALVDLEGIRTVRFHYKQEQADEATSSLSEKPLHLGVIAQTLPDGVRGYDPNTSLYGLNTTDMLGFLVVAVRGVRAEDKAAHAEIEARLKQTDADHAEIQSLKAQVVERDEKINELRVQHLNLQMQLDGMAKRLQALESR